MQPRQKATVNQIDGIDRKILKNLAEDARMPITEIGRRIGISGAAVHQRLNKLKEKGVTKQYRLIINHKLFGFTTLAFIGIHLDNPDQYPLAIKKIKTIDEVTECHYTTGKYAALIKIYCKDNEHLLEILNNKIQTIEGVSRTETIISLRQEIDREINLK